MKVIIDIPQYIKRKALFALNISSQISDEDMDDLIEKIYKRKDEPVAIDLADFGDDAEKAGLAIAILAIAGIMKRNA